MLLMFFITFIMINCVVLFYIYYIYFKLLIHLDCIITGCTINDTVIFFKKIFSQFYVCRSRHFTLTCVFLKILSSEFLPHYFTSFPPFFLTKFNIYLKSSM